MTPRRRRGAFARLVVGLLVLGILGVALFALGQQLLSTLALDKSVTPAPADARTLVESPADESPAEEPSTLPAADAPGHLGEPPKWRPRYPHIELKLGDDIGEVTHEFRFEGKLYSVRVKVDERLYWGAVDGERMITLLPGESEAERNIAYYRYMAQDPNQAPLIAEVAKGLRASAKRAGIGGDRYAEFISKYVQSIPYDFEKFRAGQTEPRFPVQTLVDGTGVCGDKSVLLGALLAHEGFDVALLLFEPEQHMAVGIRGPGRHYGDSGYLFIETTTANYISDIPENYVTGIKLASKPVIVRLGTGRQQYKSAEQIARIVTVRSTAREARDELYGQSVRQSLSRERADEVNARLKQAYEAQFKLQVIEGHEGKFLDRTPAIRWIDKNCWWE